MNVLPEDIMKETYFPEPNTVTKKMKKCLKNCFGCCLNKKKTKTLLDDVPKKMDDSSFLLQAKVKYFKGII